MEKVVLGDAAESLHRCEGKPAKLPDLGTKQGNLGRDMEVSDCPEACLNEPLCGFAVPRALSRPPEPT